MAQNTIIGLKELRENTEHYIRAVERGKSFSVVRRSQPVFEIRPIEDDDRFWDTIIDFEKVQPGGVPARDVLAMFDKIAREERTTKKKS